MNTKPELNAGETYIGAIISADGTGNHIILLPSDNDDATWQEQLDWAKSIGGVLPNRVEQAMLFAAHRDKFEERAYWSGIEVAGYESYAWSQFFLNGLQHGTHKNDELRARAVRRVAIQ